MPRLLALERGDHVLQGGQVVVLQAIDCVGQVGASFGVLLDVGGRLRLVDRDGGLLRVQQLLGVGRCHGIATTHDIGQVVLGIRPGGDIVDQLLLGGRQARGLGGFRIRRDGRGRIECLCPLSLGADLVSVRVDPSLLELQGRHTRVLGDRLGSRHAGERVRRRSSTALLQRLDRGQCGQGVHGSGVLLLRIVLLRPGLLLDDSLQPGAVAGIGQLLDLVDLAVVGLGVRVGVRQQQGIPWHLVELGLLLRGELAGLRIRQLDQRRIQHDGVGLAVHREAQRTNAGSKEGLSRLVAAQVTRGQAGDLLQRGRHLEVAVQHQLLVRLELHLERGLVLAAAFAQVLVREVNPLPVHGVVRQVEAGLLDRGDNVIAGGGVHHRDRVHILGDLVTGDGGASRRLLLRGALGNCSLQGCDRDGGRVFAVRHERADLMHVHLLAIRADVVDHPLTSIHLLVLAVQHEDVTLGDRRITALLHPMAILEHQRAAVGRRLGVALLRASSGRLLLRRRPARRGVDPELLRDIQVPQVDQRRGELGALAGVVRQPGLCLGGDEHRMLRLVLRQVSPGADALQAMVAGSRYHLAFAEHDPGPARHQLA